MKGAKGVRRTQVTPEQVKKLIEFGLITKEKENATAKLIRILTILKENGVDVTAIQKSKMVNGKQVSTIIKDIQQEGIDIETICKENGIELDYKIGQAISHTLKGAKGVRRTQVTPEQEEELIKFGLITKEEIEKARALQKAKAERNSAKNKNEKTRALEKET